jgi:signal peptidase I
VKATAKPTPNTPSPSAGHRLWVFVKSFLPVIAIVLTVRIALAEPYRIPSGSMIPTLLVGDWLFVNNLRFGPHIPFTDLNLPGYAEPRRGDVAVFVSPPQDPAIRIAPDIVTPVLVKRIAGAPGDTLLMRGGIIQVNGFAKPQPPVDPEYAEPPRDDTTPLFGWEHAVEVHGSRFGEPPARPSLHDWGPIALPAGRFMMLGDNRDNSVDSRYYGLVPRSNIRATPMFVYYSYDPDMGLDYFRAITEIRWGRIGHVIR